MSRGEPATPTILITDTMISRVPSLASHFGELSFVTVPSDGPFSGEYRGASALLRGMMDRQLFDSIVRECAGLRWIQLSTAGFDWAESDALPARVREGLVVTRTVDTLGPAIAEYVVGAMLGMARGLPRYRDAQQQKLWRSLPTREVAGSTALILGTGSLGSEVAWRARALGVEVCGVNRTGTASANFPRVVDTVGFRQLLSDADWVIVTLPLTPETVRLIGPAEMHAMKSSAVLINVGRGAVVDEPALTDALKAGTIGGAVLDVFEDEPLSVDSALWDLPNVIVTPHASYRSSGNDERLGVELRRNIERFVRGETLVGAMKHPSLGY